MNARPYDHYQYLKGNYVNSLFFPPVSSADVEEIILSLRNKPGNINTMSTSVSKRIRRHVSHVLCHIINFSLRTGIFPDCLKSARVTPIPKGVDSTNAGKYTPISRFYRSLVKYLKKLYINGYAHILNKIIYFMSINMVSEKICLLNKHY